MVRGWDRKVVRSRGHVAWRARANLWLIIMSRLPNYIWFNSVGGWAVQGRDTNAVAPGPSAFSSWVLLLLGFEGLEILFHFNMFVKLLAHFT